MNMRTITIHASMLVLVAAGLVVAQGERRPRRGDGPPPGLSDLPEDRPRRGGERPDRGGRFDRSPFGGEALESRRADVIEGLARSIERSQEEQDAMKDMLTQLRDGEPVADVMRGAPESLRRRFEQRFRDFREGRRPGRPGAEGMTPAPMDPDRLLEAIEGANPELHKRLVRWQERDPERFRRFLEERRPDLEKFVQFPELARMHMKAESIEKRIREAARDDDQDAVRAGVSELFDVRSTMLAQEIEHLEGRVESLRDRLASFEDEREQMVDEQVARMMERDEKPDAP